MIAIRKASTSDIELINQLAHEIWWDTYKTVIPDEQITFMLSKMYSLVALEEQMNKDITFLILAYEGVDEGFAAYAKHDIDKSYKLEKLYLSKTQHGKGLGRFLISRVEENVKFLGASFLYLNVNRNNNAFSFYQKVGYEVIETVDIPYFDFILNDYVMRKELK
jgi:GNAT superfamily N-acetyltransferase